MQFKGNGFVTDGMGSRSFPPRWSIMITCVKDYALCNDLSLWLVAAMLWILLPCTKI